MPTCKATTRFDEGSDEIACRLDSIGHRRHLGLDAQGFVVEWDDLENQPPNEPA